MTGDQEFEVTITMNVFNMGDTIKSRDVAKAILKALDTMPAELDFGDTDIRVQDIETDDSFGDDGFGPTD